MKTCPLCKTDKPPRDFYKKSGGSLYHSYCKECARGRVAEWYRLNREKALFKKAEEYKTNKEEKRKKYREWSWKTKIETINKYGGECACCKEQEPMFLAIDHKENNGNKHRKEIGNAKIYSWLKKNEYPKGFQVLCHNCNMAKAFWSVCPHKASELQKKAQELLDTANEL